MTISHELLSDALRPRLTVAGLTDLIMDLAKSPRGVPDMIMVSEYDRRDVNQDLLAGSVTEVAKEDRRPEHDGACIGVVQGVPIVAHPEISRGQARLCYNPKPRPAPGKLGGEGLILVGA